MPAPTFPSLFADASASGAPAVGGDDRLESRLPEGETGAGSPRPDRIWLHVLLLVLTLVTTTISGAGFYYGFLLDFGAKKTGPSVATALLGGLWYSVPVLLILGAHEMGHYLACRHYGINASLPYFLPSPPFLILGTFGAVIRIRERIRSKRMLFDIGIAGPIAGFCVAVPALFLAMAWSHVARLPTNLSEFLNFGEPLLFRLVERLFFPNVPPGYDVNLHPIGWAAWLGLLATALNLLPVGQLDGGHIAYAVLGKRARWLTPAALLVGVALGLFVSYSWLSWSIIMIVLLGLTGWAHPPTSDEGQPLDGKRLALAAVAIVMLALCFTAVPVEPLDLVRDRP